MIIYQSVQLMDIEGESGETVARINPAQISHILPASSDRKFASLVMQNGAEIRISQGQYEALGVDLADMDSSLLEWLAENDADLVQVLSARLDRIQAAIEAL